MNKNRFIICFSFFFYSTVSLYANSPSSSPSPSPSSSLKKPIHTFREIPNKDKIFYKTQNFLKDNIDNFGGRLNDLHQQQQKYNTKIMSVLKYNRDGKRNILYNIFLRPFYVKYKGKDTKISAEIKKIEHELTQYDQAQALAFHAYKIATNYSTYLSQKEQKQKERKKRMEKGVIKQILVYPDTSKQEENTTTIAELIDPRGHTTFFDSRRETPITISQEPISIIQNLRNVQPDIRQLRKNYRHQFSGYVNHLLSPERIESQRELVSVVYALIREDFQIQSSLKNFPNTLTYDAKTSKIGASTRQQIFKDPILREVLSDIQKGHTSPSPDFSDKFIQHFQQNEKRRDFLVSILNNLSIHTYADPDSLDVIFRRHKILLSFFE